MNVSVIFATYNRSEIIEDVLSAWLVCDKKTKYSYEIICSDDASSDDTADRIERFEGLPITVLRNEHGGAAKARNAALSIAKGELIIFTGDDIFPDPDFVNRHYENYKRFGSKVCTLGRIEWHRDIPQNHLMYHITNVGCEQFGFAGLVPYSMTDFRHFYTSNISVAKSELDSLEKYFDLTFDKYGFEDIELGFRLHKNGVRIFYDPDIRAEHHHIYDDIEKFCNRQKSAGDQMVVFSKLHQDARDYEELGIDRFEKLAVFFAEHRSDEDAALGAKILPEIARLKTRAQELEKQISETDDDRDRAECSAIYATVFQYAMNYGWAARYLSEQGYQMSEEELAAFCFVSLTSDFVQIFTDDGSGMTEERSDKWYRRGTVSEIEIPLDAKVKRLRIDPCNGSCTLRNVRIGLVDRDGGYHTVKYVTNSGNRTDKHDFSDNDDPQIYVKLPHSGKYTAVRAIFSVCGRDDVQSYIDKRTEDEFNKNINYDTNIYQDRRINILQSDDDKSEKRASNYILKKESGFSDEVYEDMLESVMYADVTGARVEGAGSLLYEGLTDEGESMTPKYTPEDLKAHLTEVRNTKPLVSVIIPCYNHENYIDAAIDSVLNQTYRNIELIVIDDGSKDASVEHIKAHGDDRMTVITQENCGAHNTINRGLAMAKGKYLSVLNSDDVFEPDRMERMVSYLEQHPEKEFLCSYIQIIDSEGKPLGIKQGWRDMLPWQFEHPELGFAGTDSFTLNLLASNFTSTTSNFLFTRSLYEKIGGMRNLRFAHDWDFALRAAELTGCAVLKKPLMQYRVHGSNTISSNRKWMLFEILWIWAANIGRFLGKELLASGNEKRDIVRLAESLNLQGNDKAFWMIILFIEAERKKGTEHPEEVLLENEELREQIIEYIVE